MTRGGKREGAGRKQIGVSKRVSLTLSDEEWSVIDKPEQSISSAIRQLIAENQELKNKKRKKLSKEGEGK